MKQKIKGSRERRKIEMKRDERNDVFLMFENLQIRQMNQLKMFRKILFGRITPHFCSNVQNRTVFSIIYMIRIRCFGAREFLQRHFSDAQYFYKRTT